jgi:hypothetical protein
MRPFAPLAPQSLLALLGLSLALACSEGTSPSPTDAVQAPALRTAGRSGFGFNGRVNGFPTGEVRLTGGGSFDPATANNVVPTTETSVASAGGFDCTTPVAQGPLTGCAAGEGVRWDTVQLLASVPFRCTGTDAAKLAITDDRTAVLLADFYRAGDGDEKSFTAQMIVSDGDLAPEIDGLQNLWVQGVGCGAAIVNFNGRALVIN